MKILITNHRLGVRGGTENWCELMAKTLTDMGNEVTLADDYPAEHFDLALINHLHPTEINADFKIYTSHGVIPKQEVPSLGADVYVGVSEEVQGYHGTNTVIRNPIDVERFQTDKPINKEIKRVLAISNNPIDEGFLRKACEKWEYQRIGGDNRVDNVEDYIEWADVVISLGRGAYEALAMNRNVMVYDYLGADGMVNEQNYYDFRTHNCSGRYNGWTPNYPELRDYIEEHYNPDLRMREIIVQEHHPQKIAMEYLKLCS